MRPAALGTISLQQLNLVAPAVNTTLRTPVADELYDCVLRSPMGISHAQMGGPEGVRESEQYTLVIGLKNGMSMHAVPRPGVMELFCNGVKEASQPAAENSAADEALV